MELHLHLGAHKTATTHFQGVLEKNRNLYTQNAHYVSMDEFRENATHADRFINPDCSDEVGDYLKKISEIEQRSLIVSEENILGHTGDMYRSNLLYFSIGKRLGRFKEFISNFKDVNIWISIRSMDTFIPSMYCESLLHSRYRGFRKVYSGKYAQSWVPVVLKIKETFPGAKINVIPYESYSMVLPKWLEAITGVESGWDLMDGGRPRSSFSHFAVMTMPIASLLVPQTKMTGFLQAMTGYSVKLGKGEKFMPFKEEVRLSLKALYKNDLEAIEQLGEDISIFKG